MVHNVDIPSNSNNSYVITLNSPIYVGHGNFLEPILIFIMGINVDGFFCFVLLSSYN